MKIFYCSLSVTPRPDATHLTNIQLAEIHCWARGKSADSVRLLVPFKINQEGWTIVSVKQEPIEVVREMFLERDLGLANYDRAVSDGLAFATIAIDPTVEAGPSIREVNWPADLDLNDWLETVRLNRSEGTCFYFDKSDTCDNIANAHSIQRQGALSLIADKGEVIAIDRSYSAMRANGGRISFRRAGLRKFSTFRGFCQKHDCKQFAPIECEGLGPTAEQATLYAYRAICRELLLKAQTVRILEQQLSRFSGSSATRGLFDSALKESRAAVLRLDVEKTAYDLVLQERAFSRVRYLAFHSDEAPFCVFAGCLMPEYDLGGGVIQSLRSPLETLDFVTFSFAPEKHGWTFLLAWHERSHGAVQRFVGGIIDLIRSKKSLEDALFRFVLCSSENVAFSPGWWGQQPDPIRQEILDKLGEGADMFSVPSPEPLLVGLESVANWKFVHVRDSGNLGDDASVTK